jgi:hypothetical protein
VQFSNAPEACADGNIGMNHRNQLNAVGNFKMLNVNNDGGAIDYI